MATTRTPGPRLMNCSMCGRNIEMSGSKICRICDPDLDAIITGKVQPKSPELCDRCYPQHLAEHSQK